MKALILLMLCLVLIAPGCKQGGCIKVGGGYGEYRGDVEYCFDARESEQAGTPAFTESTGDSEKTLFGFSKENINAILGKLKEKIGMSALGVNGDPGKHPVRELKKMLTDMEKKE